MAGFPNNLGGDDRTEPLGPDDFGQGYRDAAPGDILVGRHRYKLLRKLGHGGFGSVFEATVLDPEIPGEEALPPTVAVKIYDAPKEDAIVPLLKRELSSLRALRHPLIPRVYDWSFEGRNAFVVLHYYPNGSLVSMQKSGPVDYPTAWRLLADLLTALNEAHRASLLHLDIKPANVLIADDGRFVLTDFGISQGLMVSWQVVTPSLGTRGFQSPEQRGLEEEAIDARTDLWGVGATHWSLITGVNLSGNSEISKLINIDPHHGLPDLRRYRADVPEELHKIVMSMLYRDPKYRPGGAAEALARIAGYGASSDAVVISRPETGLPMGDAEITALLGSLMDPLWVSVCSQPRLRGNFLRFPAGAQIVKEGEHSYHAFLLLSGTLEILRGGQLIATEDREGTFIGEVATLTGRHRTATVRARADVIMCCFNASEFERVMVMNPAIAIRLVKTLADRLVAERGE